MRFTLATSIAALAVLTAAAPQPAAMGIRMAIPITKRSSFVNADNSVKTEALNAHVASTRAKVLRGLGKFEKNTGNPHPTASKRVQKRKTGADALTDDNSQLWFGAISVGDPLQTFTVQFDTGSSDFFLPGPDCKSNCVGHTIYHPSASSTSQDLGRSFSHSFEDKSTVSGKLYSDVVSLSGLTAADQVLGVATEYSPGLAKDQYPPDGLMGMGFQSISTYDATPVFQNLVSQGQTDKPEFSFKLAASGSELYLGGANPALYIGEFTYTPVTQQGFWQVTMDSIEGNGRTILSNIDSIIDTGTTLILGTPSDVRNLYNALGGTDASSTVGEGYYTFPCNSFPSISFTFGGTSFLISEATLNVGKVSAGSTDCVSGIVGKDTGVSFWTIGDVFLQNVYTTFDVGNSQVGFAQLA